MPCRVDADGLDINAAPKAASSARLAYVTPSHQFPSGAVMPLARRLALLAWARSTNAYVVEDDYDSEFRYDGRPIESVQALDRAGYVIYVGTMSKTLFPSLRIGFLVVPPALRKSVLAIKHLSDQHTSGVLNQCWRTSSAKGTSSGTSDACASKMPSGALCSCKHCMMRLARRP